MILTDLHTHTIASGHGTQDTINTLAKEASQRGLQILGISDHGPATPASASASYFHNLKFAPKNRYGVRIFYGIELNILDHNATIDLDHDTLSTLDYAIASMHAPTLPSGSREQNTDTYIKVMKHKKVKIIGHCHTDQYPVDFSALAQAASEFQVLLEINEASLLPESERDHDCHNCLSLLRACRSYDLPILLSSDSHGHEQIGVMKQGMLLTEQLQYPKHLILNYDLKTLLQYLQLH